MTNIATNSEEPVELTDLLIQQAEEELARITQRQKEEVAANEFWERYTKAQLGKCQSY